MYYEHVPRITDTTKPIKRQIRQLPLNLLRLLYVVSRVQSSSMLRPLQQCDAPLLTKETSLRFQSSDRWIQSESPLCPFVSTSGKVQIQAELGSLYVITKIIVYISHPKKVHLTLGQCFDIQYARKGFPVQTSRFINYPPFRIPCLNKQSEKCNYSDRKGSSIVTMTLDPTIVASTVILSECNSSTDKGKTTLNKVQSYSNPCVQFEIYGCRFSDGVLSYEYLTLPDLADDTFDGINSMMRTIEPGLGQLTDGLLGNDNYATKTPGNQFEWVGWKNHSSSPFASILFTFDIVRNFSHVMVHSNNFFTHGVEILDSAVVYFAKIEKGHASCVQTNLGRRDLKANHENIVHKEARDHNFDMARPVMINLENKIGQCVRIDMYGSSEWLLVSEVIFESTPVTSEYNHRVHILGKGAIDNDNLVSSRFLWNDTIIGIGVAFLLSLIILVSLIVMWYVQSPRRSIRPYGRAATEHSNRTETRAKAKYFNHHTSTYSRNHHFEYGVTIQSDLEMSPVPFGYGKSCTSCTSSRMTNGNTCRMVSSTETSPMILHYHKKTSMPTCKCTPTQMIMPRFSGLHGSCCSCKPIIHQGNRRHQSDINALNTEESDTYAYPTLPFSNRAWLATFSPHQSSSSIRLLDESYTFHEPLRSTRPVVPIFKLVGQNIHVYQYVSNGYQSGQWLVKILRHTASKAAKNSFDRTANIYQALLSDSNLTKHVSSFVINANVFINNIATKALILDYPTNSFELRSFLSEQFYPHVRSKGWLISNSTCDDQSHEIIKILIRPATQLAQALNFLQSINCLHCDVALHSCTAWWTCHQEGLFSTKLMDYGLLNRPGYESCYYRFNATPSSSTNSSDNRCNRETGEIAFYQIPLRWLPFDLIANSCRDDCQTFGPGNTYTVKSTIWSYGVTLWEMLQLGKHMPFAQFTDQQLIDCACMELSTGEYNQNDNKKDIIGNRSATHLLGRPYICSDHIFELIDQCLSFVEDNRPEYKEIVAKFNRSDSCV
ncbi:hypothetical protein ACOME3_009169 [Neoechinorhynchus agilis]